MLKNKKHSCVKLQVVLKYNQNLSDNRITLSTYLRNYFINTETNKHLLNIEKVLV